VSAVLLDTCAILWLVAGHAPRDGVLGVIEAARADDAMLVSPISAWEIAQKEKKRPGSLGLAAPPLAVFERLAAQPGVRLAPLTPAILVASVALDGLGTGDPVDRMIVATSRAHGARLVTADARILAFAADAIDYGRPPAG
jgi:PIN domain nuclease of toxin-antitoxin system